VSARVGRLLLLGGGSRFRGGALGAQRGMGVRAPPAAAFGAVGRNGRTGALGSTAANGRADYRGKTGYPLLLIARIALGAHLNAIYEGLVIILAKLRFGGNRVGWMKFNFLIEGQYVLLFC